MNYQVNKKLYYLIEEITDVESFYEFLRLNKRLKVRCLVTISGYDSNHHSISMWRGNNKVEVKETNNCDVWNTVRTGLRTLLGVSHNG